MNQDEHHVLHMLDFFYFEEHLVIVSELLGDNLYEFSKAVKEAGHPKYFTLPRLCKITRQCLEVTTVPAYACLRRVFRFGRQQ